MLCIMCIIEPVVLVVFMGFKRLFRCKDVTLTRMINKSTHSKRYQ